MNWLLVAITMTVLTGDGLIDSDGRWLYPHHLTFRPGDRQVCQVNPPRMSWAYVPGVLTYGESPEIWDFTLQLSKDGDFATPDLEIRTPYNFYNALPVLDLGCWHWRVGYAVGESQEQWSPVRSFQLNEDAVRWDRRSINGAANRLGALRHPRLGPSDGDWAAMRRQWETDPLAAGWVASTLQRAERTTNQRWWKAFPDSDRPGESSYDDRQFATIGADLVGATFAYRLTGDKQFLSAKDLLVKMARFEKGGLSSPEYHGAPRKWPTQLTTYLAIGYDWWYAELSEDERQTLRASIAWRLQATFFEKHSWRNGDRIARSGLGVFPQSHPYENTMWSLPGVLLTAGDLEISDQLVPLVLNYLTGVTSAHGPDEAWNEGLSYGSWKGHSMLQASMYTALLVPELELGTNPYYVRLGQWYRHLLPLGIQRLAFGDYASDPEGKRAVQRNIFRYLGWLTSDGTLALRWSVLAEETGMGPSAHPWLDLLAASKLTFPELDVDEPTSAVFPEAGWVMENTRGPSDREGFDDAVGMIFKCRPRGGYSHSYRSENDFVWHALGQTLSAGGGGTAYPDPHSRHSMSHNVMMINGRGQEWNTRSPKVPYVGRLLAHRRSDDYTYWVGDATGAYQATAGLLRWHRHVVFVDDRWFVILDDLAMRQDVSPARFSWLFHVAPKVSLKMTDSPAGFDYALGDVRATVRFAQASETLQIVDQAGRQGFVNPITGEDMLPSTQKSLESKGRELDPSDWMAHNLWVSNRERAREWTLLTVLAASRTDDQQPEISFAGPLSTEVKTSGRPSISVSFDSEKAADIQLDLAAVRRHAEQTAPAVLPPVGAREELRVADDAYRVQWLAREEFDGSLDRWAVEGNAQVGVSDGRLVVRNLDPEQRSYATIWFRPALPQNVIIRFRAKVTEPAEGNAANVNLFLHASEADGSPLRFNRAGGYSQYHEIPNYIVTLTGGMREGWSRARRDPGFNLLHEADVRSDVGCEYDVVLTFVDGRLRYYLDGRLLHDVIDTEPLEGGHFAIRTWSTNGWWDDVQFGRLVGPGE